MSNQLQISGAAKIRSIQGPVVANSGVITALDGDASQYVRGDGTLADFPTSTGGGSSVSYYLNTSVSQGTIGGVAYKQLSKVPISGAGTDVSISANGYIASYLTDANDPALLEVPAGNFNCEFYFSVNSNAHNPYVYAEVYKYDGTTFTLLGSSVSVPEYLTNGTTLSPYYFAIPVATSVLTITDRIAIRIYVNVDGRTVTLHTENNHLCQVVTTFSKGLTTLNSLTRQVQFFQTGTSGTDFAISSSIATHTFNLPVASAANTGKLSSTDWSTFNGKVPYTGATANVDLGTNNIFSSFVYAEGAGGSSNGGILIKQYSGAVAANSGYTSLFATINQLGINFSGVYNAFLQSGTFTASRTYTLPDASGTLALLESTQTFTGVNTFNNGLNLRAGFYPVPTVGDTGLASSGSGLSILLKSGVTVYTNNLQFSNASNDYTFPNATGTIALTSNLSSYVPYTGATQSVDLGINDLSSRYLFANGNGSASGILAMKISTTVTATSGYGTIGALSGQQFAFVSYLASNYNKIAYFNLSGLSDSTVRTFTLPDASGTLAILEAGTQTFTGTLNVLGLLGTKYGISIEKGNTPAPLSANDIFIYASSGATNIINFANSSYKATLSFPSSNQTYTFPAATGTLALTSDLGGYVTLATAQTISGNKTFSGTSLFTGSATFNSALHATIGVILPMTGTVSNGASIVGLGAYAGGLRTAFNGGYTSDLAFQMGANYVYTFPAATGTLALTSNLSAYLPLAGGTLTGALSGTSATFSGNMVLGTTALSGGGAAQWLTANGTLYGGGLISSVSGVAKAYYYYDNSGYAIVQGESGTGVRLVVNGSTNALTIASTGAATFSSSVTATQGKFSGSRPQGIFTENGTSGLYLRDATGTGYKSWSIGTNDIVVGFAITPSTAVGGTTFTTPSFVINEAGNVGIGISTGFNVISGTETTLQIAGVNVASLYLNSTGSNKWALFANASGSLGVYNLTASTIPFTIASTGNVGIGTTPSSWTSFTAVEGPNGNFAVTSGASLWLTSNVYYNSGWKYINTSTSSAISVASAGITFHTDASGTGGTSNAQTERMRITSAGNVGLGDSGSSNVRLQIKSGGSTSASYAIITRDSANADLLVIRDDGLINTGLKSASPYNQAISGRSAIIESTGSLGYLVSTRESKANIKSIENVNFINQLNPVQFNYRKKDADTNEFTDELYDNITYGFIADEVEKVNKELVFYNSDGTTLAGVEYNNMIAILTKAVQEQQKQIEELKQLIKNK